MSLKLFVGKSPVEIVKTTFPAGETCLRIVDSTSFYEPIYGQITMEFEDNSDLFDLALLVDAVQRHYPQKVSLALKMDYLPYARQDRVCNKGESLSVKVLADFINSLGFVKVYCKDIHSPVGNALLNNLINIDVSNCAYRLCHIFSNLETTLVSPDAGSEKKVFDFAKQFGYTDIVRATKIRDVSTGKIEQTSVLNEATLQGPVLIIDDICDGGRTFIELAKVLKTRYPNREICLYVTHGIFSAGMEVFDNVIDKIYTANLMNKSLSGHAKLTVI